MELERVLEQAVPGLAAALVLEELERVRQGHLEVLVLEPRALPLFLVRDVPVMLMVI